jgi:TPR repeat protein
MWGRACPDVTPSGLAVLGAAVGFLSGVACAAQPPATTSPSEGAQAEREAGERFYCGRCATQDYAEAMVWFLKAAAHGDAVAQNDIGLMFQNGQGVARTMRRR